MKYKITGIDPNITIKNYKIDKNGIKVTYLKGGSDFHSVEKREIIDNKMLEQSKMFIDDKKNKISDSSLVFLILTIMFGLGGLSLLISGQIIAFAFLIGSVISGIIAKIVFQKDTEYKKKYKLYLENKETLEVKYDNVISNEKTLCKEKANEQIEQNNCIINELDKMSLKELKGMLAKVKRYQEIEPEVIEFDYQKRLGK